MKKLFIAAMALATIVSCSKDDGDAVLTSSKKAVSITIENGVSGTRALIESTPTTAGGGEGEILAQENKQVAANIDELVVLFANRNGDVVDAYAFSDADILEDVDQIPNVAGDANTEGKYSYLFHNIHESVEQVAVVRYSKITDVEEYKNTNLKTYADAAAEEKLTVDLDDLELYGSNTIATDGSTCKVKNVAADGHVTEYEYKLYTASVKVAPALARVEIVGISCLDLGQTTLANVTDATKTGGYDELALERIYFGDQDEEGDKPYYYNFTEKDVLMGVYAGQRSTTARDLVPYSPGKDSAIAWNISPDVPIPSTGTPMVLSMKASAYDYNVISGDKTLTINGFEENIAKFEPGNIYRMNINFKEENLDKTNDAICVDVTVTIANWVVINVTPEFGSGN